MRRAAVVVGLVLAGVAPEARAADAPEAPPVRVRPIVRDPSKASWFALQATERVAEHLVARGLWRTERVARGQLDVAVGCDPDEVERATATVTLTARVTHGKRTTRLRVRDQAADLDAMAERLAAQALKWWGGEPGAAGLAPHAYPFAIHRFLGRARQRLVRGDARRAALMFGRASEIVDGLWVPEALEGRRAAEDWLVTAGGRAMSDKRDLADAAHERATVAFDNKRWGEATDGFESFLRYTQARALRWRRAWPLGDAAVVARRAPWSVQPRVGPRVEIDPRTGITVAEGPRLDGLVARLQGDLLRLDGRTLTRQPKDGPARWRTTLPAAPGPAGTVLTSGLFGVLGEDSVSWTDASLGELGQIARGVVPLAAGPGGVVVLSRGVDAGSGPDVALLRPGKRAPAWRSAVESPRDAALTRDRVVLATPDGLVLLRSHDGKPAAKALPLGGAARLLGASGRYAAFSEAKGQVALFDILAGERTATLRGPGAPVAARTSGEGVAVLYDTGDLLFVHRDGEILDRAWVPGRPVALWRGAPETPGVVVGTETGLYAFGAVEKGRPRDVDAELRLARIRAAQGAAQDALRRAEALAARSAGRVAEAEALRAELLAKRPGQETARAAAAARAARGKDPTQSLGPYTAR